MGQICQNFELILPAALLCVIDYTMLLFEDLLKIVFLGLKSTSAEKFLAMKSKLATNVSRSVAEWSKALV